MIEGHGDDLYKYNDNIRINFSSNIYNHVSYNELHEFIKVKLNLIHSYPSPLPYKAEERIAIVSGISNKEICMTNGATEAIYIIAQLYKNRKTTILIPTFSEYEDACRIHNHKITFSTSIHHIDKESEIVWICNPNNPTGEVVDKLIVEKIINDNPEKLFVIDQSYECFTDKPLFAAHEAKEYKNVIIIHSMTKEYAVPGLRIGYITACKDIIKKIISQRMPWSVNTLAIETAIFLADNPKIYNFNLRQLLSEKDRIIESLKKIDGIEPLPSDTHFILIKLNRGRASELKEYLIANYGILIRDASNFRGLDENYFRIAIQTSNENDELIKRIEEWINL